MKRRIASWWHAHTDRPVPVKVRTEVRGNVTVHYYR